MNRVLIYELDVEKETSSGSIDQILMGQTIEAWLRGPLILHMDRISIARIPDLGLIHVLVERDPTEEARPVFSMLLNMGPPDIDVSEERLLRMTAMIMYELWTYSKKFNMIHETSEDLFALMGPVQDA